MEPVGDDRVEELSLSVNELEMAEALRSLRGKRASDVVLQ